LGRPVPRRPYRLLLAGALLALTTLPCGPAYAARVDIGFRPGGDVYTHIAQALDMLRSGRSYRVTGDQYSAAAIQVVYLKSKMPGRICATRGATLNFHLGFDKDTGSSMQKPDIVWVKLMGPETLRRLGPLPEYGKGFKTVRASDYLGLCK